MGSNHCSEEALVAFAEVLYKCTLCASSTTILPDKSTFVRHMKALHLNTSLDLVDCPQCEFRFANKRDLQNHIINSHLFMDNDDNIVPAPQTPPKLSDNVNMLKVNHNRVTVVTSSDLTDFQSPSENQQQQPRVIHSAIDNSEAALSVQNLLLSESKTTSAQTIGNETIMASTASTSVAESRVGLQTSVNGVPQSNEHLFVTSQANSKLSVPISVVSEDKISKSELENKFGKFASSIVIKGASYYYCQVCRWKTDSDELFHGHFSSEEHQRIVQKLQPQVLNISSKSPLINAGTTIPSAVSITLDNTDKELLKASISAPIVSTVDTAIPMDLVTELTQLTDPVADVVSIIASQSNKRKQSMPVAVRRPLDTTFDISLDEFSDSILDMDMYPDSFYETLGDCIEPHETDVLVKEEPINKDLTSKPSDAIVDSPGILSQYFGANTSNVPSTSSASSTPEKSIDNRKRLSDTVSLHLSPTTHHAANSCGTSLSPIKNINDVIKSLNKPAHSTSVNALMDILPTFLEVCSPKFDDSQPSRDAILTIASEILNDVTVMSWKSDCDKAIKKLFPNCKIKRKGQVKAKTIHYLGLKLIKEFEGSLANKKNTGTNEKRNGKSKSTTPSPKGAKKAKISVSPFGEITILQPSGESSIVNPAELKVNVRTINVQAPPTPPKSAPIAMRSVPDSGIGSIIHLAKFITLYPGPFVTTRNVCQKYRTSTGHAPHVDTAIEAMSLLQTFQLGEYMGLDNGCTKVFFKTIPSLLNEENSSNINVKRAVYQAIFSERDGKLDSILHDKLKKAYAQKYSNLIEFYSH